MSQRWEQLRIALHETFSEPKGWLFAALGALFVILLALLLPSLHLLDFIFRERLFDGPLKTVTAAQVIWNGRLVFRHQGGWLILLMAGLFGIDASLIAHYMRRQMRVSRAAGASAFGMLVGLLGVGCASCGSVFLTSLVGMGATVGALSWLPLHGQEFTWLGILIAIFSMFSVAGKIVAPQACRIEKR